MNYAIQLLLYFEIYLIVALSLNLLVGYLGLLSLAHAVFYGIGAYGYALLSIRLGLGFGLALLGAMALAALASLTISLCALRLKGDFFVLGSLAVQVIFFSIVQNWYDGTSAVGTWTNLTNGPFGVAGVPKPEVFSVPFVDPLAFLGLSTAVCGLAMLAVWRFTSGDWGRMLVAIRDDDLAARGLGKNVRLARVQVIAIAAALAAVAGSIYAAQVGFVDPSSASIDESILMLSMVLLGGSGNFRGPVVGAITLMALPEILRFLAFPDAQAANIRLAIYGFALILIVHFRPQGLAGNYRLS